MTSSPKTSRSKCSKEGETKTSNAPTKEFRYYTILLNEDSENDVTGNPPTIGLESSSQHPAQQEKEDITYRLGRLLKVI